MSLTLQRIEGLAPDQASLASARKLLKPSCWPTLAEGEGLVWGECQGSGATPYCVVVSEADAGYKCTCPSRKFPCKHTLALMWMRADKGGSFAPAPIPEWVKDWLSRRRGTSKAAGKSEDEAQKPKSRPSIRLTEIPEAGANVDPKAEQRAAAARERNRLEGIAKEDERHPATAATGVLVPDSARAKREQLYQTANTDQNGHYLIRGVEPGSYTAYAFEEDQQEIWLDPEEMKTYKDTGVPVSVHQDEKTHIELPVAASRNAQQDQ